MTGTLFKNRTACILQKTFFWLCFGTACGWKWSSYYSFYSNNFQHSATITIKKWPVTIYTMN